MKRNLTPIASGVALFLMGVAMSAQAQQTDDNKDVQTVVTTGIRASLQQSLNQKKRSNSVVEVVTAEDVGKMPDKNVADSLQRLPGVSVATAGGTEGGFGENDRVALRGAPAALTLTTLNGHTVSSGDWYVTNIQSGGRSVSYSMFPSELIGKVTVHKSSQADLLEGGAAGSVDIETRKPLDFKKTLTVMGSLEAARTQAAGKTDAQISALVNWKNDAGTFGVMGQAFDEKRHLQRMGQEFLWWQPLDASGAPGLIAAHPELNGVMMSWLTGAVQFKQERERRGGLVDFQIKPTSDLMFDLSAFYTKLKADNINANFMLSPYQALTNNWSNVGTVEPTSYTVSGVPGSQTMTSWQFPATCPAGKDCSGMATTVEDVISRPGSYADSKFVNLDAKFRATDSLTLTGKLGTTRGTGHAQDYGFETWLPYSGIGLTQHATDDASDMVAPDAGTFNLLRNGSWASRTTSTDKETYGQFDGELSTDWANIPMVRFGVRTAKHDRSLEWITGTPNAAIPDASGLEPYGSNPFSGGLQPWTFSADSVNAWGDANVSFTNPDGTLAHSYQNEFSLTEKAKSAYLMGDLSSESVHGNFGVRFVRTDEHVENASPNAVWDPVITENHYTDILPSANFKIDLAKNWVGRFAVSRTMARPEIGSLAALALQDVQLSGSGGNPNLKPIRSTNMDLGLEWYFADKSLVSVDLYNMDFESYVTYGSTTGIFYNQAQKKNTTYNLTSAVNTTAQLRGIELNYVQTLQSGFGWDANYTYADGQETGKAPNSACAATLNPDCRMVGTSQNSYNLGVFYENDKFNVRTVWSWRSAFLNGLDRNSAITQEAVGTLGLSATYNITDNLALSFEGKDLNDPLLSSYAGATKDQPRAFYKNGRQYYLGLRVKM